jgi:uncharacterized damage-inducible protein DinB
MKSDRTNHVRTDESAPQAGKFPALVGGPCEDHLMTITRTDFPNVADERTLLTSFLDYQRQTLAMKCERLTDEQIRTRSVEPSGLSLLGLVRHMTKVERVWFRNTIGGQDLPLLYSSPQDPDADFDQLDTPPVAEVFERWHAETEAARAVAAARDLDAIGTRFVRQTGQKEDFSLRWVLIHMIEEYARHNGHADLLRERIDGVVGE